MVLSERAQSQLAQPLTQLPRIAIDPQQRHGNQVELTSPQRRYLERVRRLRDQDPFLVFDGSGHQWLVRLGSSVAVIEQRVGSTTLELPLYTHLGLAVVKGGGFDETIRSLTELGIHELTPLLTARTQVDPKPTKITRWQTIAREAAEQCERSRWPQINPPQSWAAWLAGAQGMVCMAVARIDGPHFWHVLQDPSLSSIALAIGPEGGWTEAERRQGQEGRIQEVSLGSRILRAVTAPIAAASLIAASVDTRMTGS